MLCAVSVNFTFCIMFPCGLLVTSQRAVPTNLAVQDFVSLMCTSADELGGNLRGD
jgi:hypothetical protein